MAASGGEGDTPGAASLDLADLSFDISASGTEDGKIDLVDVVAPEGALNGPVENGYLDGAADKPVSDVGGDVVAESIEEAAAVIVECAMNGALHVAMNHPAAAAEAGAGGGSVPRRRAADFTFPDSGITLSNGIGKDHIEMDTSEPNGSTTTDTSALSEVIDPVADKAAETAEDNEQLVDVMDVVVDEEENQGAGDMRQEETEDNIKTEELDEDIVIPSIHTTEPDDDEFAFDSPKKEAPKGDETHPGVPSIRIDYDDDDDFNFSIGGMKPPAIQVIAASPSVEDREFILEEAGETSTDDQDAWAGVKEITPTFAEEGAASGAKQVEASPLISYHEAYDHISRSDLDQYLSQINTTVPRRGFNKLRHLIFGPPKLHRDLHTQRDTIFCMATAQLRNDNPVHSQILQTLYRKLTGSKFDCTRFGSHWEQIGFQGNDPATDLRGGGMLGLLQLLYMVSDPRLIPLTRDIYKLSRHDEQNFPFSLMGINMSRICIQALREDCLNKECNRRKSVIEAMNEFFMACYHHLYSVWKYQGKTIKDSGYVIKDVEAYAKKNPVTLLRALETYLQRKKAGGASPAKAEAFKGIAEMDSDEDN